MNDTKMHTLTVLFLLAAALAVCSCKQKEPAEPAAPEEPNATAAVTIETKIEQTTCPVMGGQINKNIFVEYKGKKVYFCCPSCLEEFNKNPEKYIAKLPQFQK
jgi:YHS domain-containing protein